MCQAAHEMRPLKAIPGMPQQRCLPQPSLPAKPSEACTTQAVGPLHRHQHLLYTKALKTPPISIMLEGSRMLCQHMHIKRALTLGNQSCKGQVADTPELALAKIQRPRHSLIEHGKQQEASPVVEALLWLWQCRERCSSSAFRSSVSYSSLSCLTLSRRLWHSCSALSTSSAERAACPGDSLMLGRCKYGSGPRCCEASVRLPECCPLLDVLGYT